MLENPTIGEYQIMASLKRVAASAAAVLLAGAFLTGCNHLSTTADPADGRVVVSRANIDAAVRDVKPALVRIRVVSPSYRDGREMKYISYGSGTIVSPDGYVVTNHHVAGSAIALTCTLANREEVGATLVGTDAATDIAVIKLDPHPDGAAYPHARWGDSDTMRVGDPVLALGSPLSISQSVTLGILSNTEMIAPPSFGAGYRFELDGEDVGRLVRWFGHDAAIFPGNSGGPLINLQGRIIGINEIGMGLGGAIPGNLARAVSEELVEQGYIRRTYYGLEIQRMLKGSDPRDGVLLASVNPDSPAREAGLRTGDIILAVDGRRLSGRFGEDLPGINNWLATRPIGEPVDFLVHRDGEELTLPVSAIEREPAYIPSVEFREWGMTARDVNRWTNLRMAREDKGGVLITTTRSGGPISRGRPEMRRNDLIHSLDGKPVSTVGDVRSFTGETVSGEEGDFTPVLVEFEREGETMLSVVEIGVDALQPPGREVQRAWVPLETQVVTREIARQVGREDLKGVRVTRIFEEHQDDSPFQVGDIITHLDGDPIEASRQEDAEVFRTLIRQYRQGMEVEFRVLRGGETVTLETVLLDSPPQTREMNRFRDLDFEFVAREASFNDRHRPTLVGEDFAVIADSVTSGGWANVGGLSVGDAILEVNGVRITSLDDLAREMERAGMEEAPYVIFLVRRDTSRIFLEFETAW